MDETAVSDTIAAGELRQLIERIERLEEYTKAIRAIQRLRKKDAAERQEEEAILDMYKAAIGMA